MSRKNNNPRGIILILIAMMVFSVQDGIMKHIYNFVSLYEIYLIRTVVSFILILIFLIIKKKPIVFKSQYPILTLCRVILFFFGFSFVLYITNSIAFRNCYSFIFRYSFFNYNICTFFFKRRDRSKKVGCHSCRVYWSLHNLKSRF